MPPTSTPALLARRVIAPAPGQAPLARPGGAVPARCDSGRMPRSRLLLALPFAVGALLGGCQSDGPASARIAAPVEGQASDVVEGSGETDQDYGLVPGPDGRVFLVLDCAAAEGRVSLTARREDGKGWGAASPGPELTVPCDADGQRLAILGTGPPGTPIPLTVRTAGEKWRVAQTYRRPNG